MRQIQLNQVEINKGRRMTEDVGGSAGADNNAGGIAAAQCAYELKYFFKPIRDVNVIIEDDDTDSPMEYATTYHDALAAVDRILDNMATFFRNPQAGGTPLIDPSAAPILLYESQQLRLIVDRIWRAKYAVDSKAGAYRGNVEGRRARFWKWLKRGFNSADIIIDSLQSSFPPLSFVGEFKKQVKNMTE